MAILSPNGFQLMTAYNQNGRTAIAKQPHNFQQSSCASYSFLAIHRVKLVSRNGISQHSLLHYYCEFKCIFEFHLCTKAGNWNRSNTRFSLKRGPHIWLSRLIELLSSTTLLFSLKIFVPKAVNLKQFQNYFFRHLNHIDLHLTH